jgi:hypothetical protein
VPDRRRGGAGFGEEEGMAGTDEEEGEELRGKGLMSFGWRGMAERDLSG